MSNRDFRLVQFVSSGMWQVTSICLYQASSFKGGANARAAKRRIARLMNSITKFKYLSANGLREVKETTFDFCVWKVVTHRIDASHFKVHHD